MEMFNFINRFKYVLFFLLIYLISYFYIRKENFLIHSVSYTTSENNSISYSHSVSIGDFGIPSLQGNSNYIIANISYYIYFPLRITESAYWSLFPSKYDLKK